MKTWVKKTDEVKPLSAKDLVVLQNLFLFDWDRVRSFDTLFPERSHTTKENKTLYFDKVFKKNPQAAYDYIDELNSKKFKNLYLTRETLIMSIMEDIKEIKKEKKWISLSPLYALVAKMSGYLIDKHYIEISAPVQIQYLPPSDDENNTISIDPI